MSDDPTSTRRRYWDKQSVRYDKAMGQFDRFVFGDSRAWVCSKATGRTLEVGIGTGLNLPFYPADLELTGIDLSPGMLEIARGRAAELGRTVELREADAQRMPFGDHSFDSAVVTFTLCAVPDVADTLAEIDRVLRPGGLLLLADHVRPTFAPLRWMLRGVEWLSERFEPGNGERFLRRPFETVQANGYRIDQHQRFKAGVVERLSARKPS